MTEAQRVSDVCAAAVATVLSVSEGNIKRLRAGTGTTTSVGVYIRDFLDLVDAVEALYPGLVANLRAERQA